MKMLLKKTRGRKGQGLVEYALIIVLIAVLAITFLTNMGTAASKGLSQIASALTAAV